jgi:small subunit ribosomal protein S4e
MAKKHLKRLNTKRRCQNSKCGGVFVIKSRAGPHKLVESVPVGALVKNHLKYALNYAEVKQVTKAGNIAVDKSVRTDFKFPVGFMDVVEIEKTGEKFRLLYDVKGRFKLKPIKEDEASFKLCMVTKVGTGAGGVPYLVTHDGRTVRYPSVGVNVGDTVEYSLVDNKITNWIKCETGNVCMITRGANIGRVGTITSAKKFLGSSTMVYLKDTTGKTFSTRKENVFTIGKGIKPLVTLPADRGVRKTIAEERDARMAARMA